MPTIPKVTRRKHMPSDVTVRFVPPEPGTEKLHEQRIADAASFFYKLGAGTEKLLPLLATVALFAGCGGIRFHESPKEEIRPVEVFITKLPTRPYNEIGLIHVSSGMGSDKVIDKIRERAQRMHGDGVIVKLAASTFSDGLTGEGLVVNEGVVIVWTDK